MATELKVARKAPHSLTDYRAMAASLRFLSADMVQKAASGHPGLPLGMADVVTVLFRDFLRFDPSHPRWPNRDRFILSAGHGSALLYSLLCLLGFEDLTLEDLQTFRQLGSRCAGHPEYGHASGIETTTGPLGQGFANAVGMALAAKLQEARTPDLINHRIYALVSDGDLMEGIAQESLSLAGHLKLHNLIVLFDDNEVSIDGPTSLTVSDQQRKRFEASGWQTLEVDGHDYDAIFQTLSKAQDLSETRLGPVLIACKTRIGKGAPTKEGSCTVHGAPLGEKELEAMRHSYGWVYTSFVIPEDIKHLWAACSDKGRDAYALWTAQKEQSAEVKFFDRIEKGEGELGEDLSRLLKLSIEELKKEEGFRSAALATRQSSQKVLEKLSPHFEQVKSLHLIGGSADLTPSNNTKVGIQKKVEAGDFTGSYIHYGIREHAMAAMMNGMSLYGGIIPYGGTFLVFSDYLRPALRLSALMQQGVIYVLTHDSIGLGEDGPTHQPIEHFAALRAIPHLHFFRPADALETAEAWEIALRNRSSPSVLALSRQPLVCHRSGDGASPNVTANLTALGGYVLKGASHRRLTLMATGSEVGLVVEAHNLLKDQGIETAVVSMPCLSLFEQQSETYRESVLPSKGPRLAVEAGVRFGWDRYLKEGDDFIGLSDFGASAPAEDLYTHFGLTVEKIVQRALELIGYERS